MRTEVRYEDYARKFLEQLPRGAFLSVRGPRDNVMTIGWGTIGYMWKKPVLMVMVRPSRYSYGLLENAGVFTVSVPLDQDLQDQLLACGKNSGRNLDKFREFGLSRVPAAGLLDTPVVGQCRLHFECRTLYRQELDPENLDQVINDTAYNNGDYHVLYYGEILEAYLLDPEEVNN